jgi:beta-mannosidase
VPSVPRSTPLDGRWCARLADDELRRSGLGIDHDDDDWPEVHVPGQWRHHPEFADGDGPMLYRTRFDHRSPGPDERLAVVLHGVMYQADVWLDGAYLGDPEGYATSHVLDVTDLARLADDHVLAVEVSCPRVDADSPRRTLTGRLQDGSYLPPGWNPGGLWRPVELRTTGVARLDRCRIVCRDANTTRAHLRFHATVDVVDARTVEIVTRVDGVVLHRHRSPLAHGPNVVAWNVDVDKPRLWWPWQLGEQPRSAVSVEVLVDGVRSDHHEVLVGLREVAMRDWVFTVNGERLFLKGAVLGPSDVDLARTPVERLRGDVALARDAGLDLVRLQGYVGHDALYDAADELGMLVWQDMPLTGRHARSVRRTAVRQSAAIVDRLAHHASIAWWCAHDTPETTVARQQFPTWNRSVLDRWVKVAIERADPSRPVLANSGIPPHLPLLDGADTSLRAGWAVDDRRRLGGLAAAFPRLVRFVSDVGTMSHPGARSQVDDPEVLASQQQQALVLRRQIETLRRLKFRPTAGFCCASLVDAYPGSSSSVVDHDRWPKLALSALTDACRPVIIVADDLPDTVARGDTFAIDVHVVSELRAPLLDVTAAGLLRWAGGEHRWMWRGDVPADACARIGTIQFVVPEVTGDLHLDLALDHPEFTATNRFTTTIT